MQLRSLKQRNEKGYRKMCKLVKSDCVIRPSERYLLCLHALFSFGALWIEASGISQHILNPENGI
jgi:hypothetical protein